MSTRTWMPSLWCFNEPECVGHMFPLLTHISLLRGLSLRAAYPATCFN